MNRKTASLILAMCAFSCLVGCGGNNADNEAVQTNAPKPTETPQATEIVYTTYTIETPFAKMQYPDKWKDVVRVETTDDSVAFYAKLKGKAEQPLFTLQFGESKGYHLGTMGDTEVYIIEKTPEFDKSWTENEKQTIYDMQESVNFILQGLTETDGFVFAS